MSKEQKEFFEYTAGLGIFRSLTDFILNVVQSKAQEIVNTHHKILTTKREQEIFFDFVFKDVEQNQELKPALREYNELL